ncbi:hypothetical protein [Enterococcus sp. BWR-S5]|uniref:hypothetical protein n=1 Tax=Enterococcus sp. BWR-S5 TaxID=2787714 RepID=UPI0019227245|nr:hypothetical protein [Enterococcus sp. BWR-S5]MBL1224470.1 hypothetical protein [Enterococcus sp. BWR-S5]
MLQNEDVEAEFRFLTTEEGGRKTPTKSGYRPDHLIKPDYLTCGRHTYYEKEWVALGETVLGTIKFIDPPSYRHSLEVGQRISFQEGARIVGYAKIIQIFNEDLKR